MSEAERSSLVLGCNNSTDPEAADSEGLGRYDCRDTFSNFEFEGPDGDTAPFRCGSWDCYCCGYRMRQNLVEEIQRVCTQRPAIRRMMTLTLDPATAPARQESQHRYLTERWNALRTALSRRFGGDLSFIWVREEGESGNPHLHILVNQFIPQKWLSATWSELGGGEVVHITGIERVEKAAHYVGKYLTKEAFTGLPDGIRRYGSSQDISLSVRGGDDSEGDWRLLMDDYATEPVDGDGPLRRGVASEDFVQQREWDGPVPPDAVLGG
jgi:hypothetical protein